MRRHCRDLGKGKPAGSCDRFSVDALLKQGKDLVALRQSDLFSHRPCLSSLSRAFPISDSSSSERSLIPPVPSNLRNLCQRFRLIRTVTETLWERPVPEGRPTP